MQISVSLPDKLVAQVRARAAAENRPVSNMIAVLLYAALAEPEDWQPAVALRESVFRGPDPKTGRK